MLIFSTRLAFFYDFMHKLPMSILTIYVDPHPVLHQKAQPITTVDNKIKTLMSDMKDTLKALKGVGLAANQVGILKRVIVLNTTYCREVDEDKTLPEGIIAMANPVITWKSDNLTWIKEGCFSVPNIFTDVERPDQCTVKYLDEQGKKQTIKTGPGLFNACLQHEIDHLDGILFPERVSKLKQKRIDKKYRKISPTFNEDLTYKFITEGP